MLLPEISPLQRSPAPPHEQWLVLPPHLPTPPSLLLPQVRPIHLAVVIRITRFQGMLSRCLSSETPGSSAGEGMQQEGMEMEEDRCRARGHWASHRRCVPEPLPDYLPEPSTGPAKGKT